MADAGNTQNISAEQIRAARELQNQSAVPPLIQPCKKCWIEVALLDEEDRGVAREPYWIKLPDGAIREGSLDADGLVRFDGIPCGTCIVRFPGMDELEVQSKTALPDGKLDWIEILLLDDARQPIAEEPYTIDLPDGSERQGKLDKQGKARIEGIAAGNCVVRFPNIDAGDFVEG